MTTRVTLALHRACLHPARAAALALLLLGCQSEAPARPAVDTPSPQGKPTAASAAGLTTATLQQVEPAQQLDPYTPQRTRSGLLRFAHEALHDNPAAAAELLRRLDEGGSSELRVALV